MRLEETEIKLKSMLGETYRFSIDNKLHKILDYVVENDRITIITDQESFNKPIESVVTFLSGFRKDEELIKHSAQLPEPVWKTKMNENIEKLGSTLFDNLEKLKTDPNFVDQAREINNHVNTIINMAKLQIQLNK